MKNRKLHFSFNRQERSGIFFLLLCIFLLQSFYYLYLSTGSLNPQPVFLPDSSLTEGLLPQNIPGDSNRQFPFNPNFLSDFKGYTLGMSVSELDRLYKFRAENKFVNSAAEFQQVTGISDSLLAKLAPLFRFPEWVANKRQSPKPGKKSGTGSQHIMESGKGAQDLNEVTAAELREIRGIGPVLSERIIRFREALGGFVSDEQLRDVYGLDTEIADRALHRFRVLEVPEISRININSATVEQLAGNAYINITLAREIVRYREEVGSIGSLDEIIHLKGFPAGKINRIRLYLTL